MLITSPKFAAIKICYLEFALSRRFCGLYFTKIGKTFKKSGTSKSDYSEKGKKLDAKLSDMQNLGIQ